MVRIISISVPDSEVLPRSFADWFPLALSLALEQRAGGENLLVFPEYTNHALLTSKSMYEASEILLTMASEAAVHNGVYIQVCGVDPVRHVPTAYIFDTRGVCVNQTTKATLTEGERELGMQVGTSNGAEPIEIGGIQMGTAICFDAFSNEYRQALADKGTELLLVPSANQRAWNSLTDDGVWQPLDWTKVTVDSLGFGNIRCVVNPLLQDKGFEGQSAITVRSAQHHPCPYLGVKRQYLVNFVYCADYPIQKRGWIGSIDLKPKN